MFIWTLSVYVGHVETTGRLTLYQQRIQNPRVVRKSVIMILHRSTRKLRDNLSEWAAIIQGCAYVRRVAPTRARASGVPRLWTVETHSPKLQREEGNSIALLWPLCIRRAIPTADSRFSSPLDTDCWSLPDRFRFYRFFIPDAKYHFVNNELRLQSLRSYLWPSKCMKLLQLLSSF